jgi:hypothetical protein
MRKEEKQRERKLKRERERETERKPLSLPCMAVIFGYGVLRLIISHNVTPKLHTSDDLEYTCRSNASGAIHFYQIKNGRIKKKKWPSLRNSTIS